MTTDEQRLRQIVQAIDDWVSTRLLVGVDIRRDEPPAEQGDDYYVAYDVTFTPRSLRKAKLEVYVTSDGYTGIGIERWDRVAARLGVATSSESYGGGFEPQDLAVDDVIRICDLICDGQLQICAYSGRRRLVGCVLIVQHGAFGRHSFDPFGLLTEFWLLRALGKTGLVRETELTYVSWEAHDN